MPLKQTIIRTGTILAALLIAVLNTGCDLGSSEDLSYNLDGVETFSAPAPDANPSTAPAGTTPAKPAENTSSIAPTPSNAPSGIGTPGRRGGFLWKPVSESDGRLVVLLPTSYKGNVTMCYMTSDSGVLIESGRFVGDTHNGNRPHYRFSKPGAQYGSNRYIVAVNNDGSLHHWFIPNGASRVTY